MSNLYYIQFNVPKMIGNETVYMQEALTEQRRISGGGYYTQASEAMLCKLTQTHHAVLTSSCTHALEATALLLDIQDGDEVIMPSFTFVSTVNAFVLRGAKPVFVDIRQDTQNIDESLIEQAITPKTRAIVVVHYAGIACEMDAIMEIAQRHQLAVVEDNAHGLFGCYKGHALGSIGDMATLSFHETKNIICGEGGALLTNSQHYFEQAEIIREKGTNRAQFFRGMVDKYSWVRVGSSYLMSDMMAGFLYGQLENHDKIQAHRHAIWQRYHLELADWARQYGIQQPSVPSHCEHPAHIYYLLLPNLEQRQAFIEHMQRNMVQTPFHYVPLHTSIMGKTFGYQAGDLPLTEDTSDRLVRLPLYWSLNEPYVDRIIQMAKAFRI